MTCATLLLMKTSLTLYFCRHAKEYREQYPNMRLDSITNVRDLHPDRDEIYAFNFFFNELVPCVAGRKVWTLRERASKLISEAKRVVSVLDEAFVILALTNYWDRWTSQGMAKWTDSRAGNYQYMGWADAAYVSFDEICNRIREQRKNETNKRLEKMFLAGSRSLLAGGDKKQENSVNKLKHMWRYTMNWIVRRRVNEYYLIQYN